MDGRKIVYDFIEDYAKKKELRCTSATLQMIRDRMNRDEDLSLVNIGGVSRFRGHYLHGLTVCRLLINLILPISHDEEDVVLSAALGHILTNQMDFSELEEIFRLEYRMDPRICEIIYLITNDTDLSEEGQRLFYERIRNNKLAILVFLADRANLLEQLYNLSIWSANEYIYETRTYLFPICFHIKENNPELIPSVNILMEKVRTMTDACAVLFGRYEKREMELTTDILNLREENSRLRSFIRKMEDERKA